LHLGTQLAAANDCPFSIILLMREKVDVEILNTAFSDGFTLLHVNFSKRIILCVPLTKRRLLKHALLTSIKVK